MTREPQPWTIVEGTEGHERCLGRYAFFAPEIQGQVVLDCACGTGIGTRILARAGAKRVVGVDLEEGALDEARGRCREMSNVEFVRGDATRLDFPDATFDVVITSETIEHVADWRRFFSEMTRVLRRDGLFGLTTPNRPVFSPLRLRPSAASHVFEVSTRGLEWRLGRRFEEVEVFGQFFRRDADVVRLVREGFNAWTPEWFRRPIIAAKSRLGRSGAPAGETPEEPLDIPLRSRVMPPGLFPGCSPTYTVARCRRPIV